jgi:polar amino acid transport system permease protein
MTGIWNDWLAHDSELLRGLLASVKLAAATLLLGLPLGLLLAVTTSSRNRVVRALTVAGVEIGRGTPALIMLQIVYVGLPDVGLTFGAFLCATVALGLTTAAYSSEIIRGGLQAVPDGEIEAGDALGMSRGDVLRFVVVPQGLRIAIPPLVGFMIIMFQATSLAYSISYRELTSVAKSSSSLEFNALNMFILAGLLYAAITIPASWLSDRVDRRMSRHL